MTAECWAAPGADFGSGNYAAPFPFFKSSGRGIEMML
jgi:hypothetical protein